MGYQFSSLSKLSTVLCLSGLLLACQRNSVTEVTPLSSEQQAIAANYLENDEIPSTTLDDKPLQNACEKFRGKLPQDITQGFIEVPEDPAKPEGIKIKVFYYGSIRPNSTPVVFFNGGPAGDSHSSFNSIGDAQKTFDPDKKLSFIFIDQRGTGCSDFYPQGRTAETLERLSHYGTRGIVADAEAVRKTLFGEKAWRIFGQSYGAFVNHRYVTIAPEGVLSSHSHANTINSDGYQRLKERIASQIRVSDIYFRQFPTDRLILQKLQSELTPEKCYRSGKQRVCGIDVISYFTGQFLGFSYKWIKLHQWLNLIATPDGIDEAGMQRFLATFVFLPLNPLESKGTAKRVIGWVDRNIEATNFENCSKIMADLANDGMNLPSPYFTECAKALQMGAISSNDDTQDPVLSLPQDKLTIEDLATSLRSHPNLYFYLYSGQLDPFVPVKNFAEELAVIGTFSNVHYTNFEGTGHDGFSQEPLVWKNLLK